MDLDMMRRHLEQARQHVTQGNRLIARQRVLIAKLEAAGHDSAAARKLLLQLEELQQSHVSDCDRLEKELADSAAL